MVIVDCSSLDCGFRQATEGIFLARFSRFAGYARASGSVEGNLSFVTQGLATSPRFARRCVTHLGYLYAARFAGWCDVGSSFLPTL